MKSLFFIECQAYFFKFYLFDVQQQQQKKQLTFHLGRRRHCSNLIKKHDIIHVVSPVHFFFGFSAIDGARAAERIQ